MKPDDLPRSPVPRLLPVLAGGLAAAVTFANRGFVVDDAYIPLAYARTLATGGGYRFSPGGPIADGVTPLPWAPLLVPVVAACQGDLNRALGVVRVLGALAFVAGIALLARALAQPKWMQNAPVLIAAAALPCTMHAVSGLEMPLFFLLAVIAASERRPLYAAAAAGLAATLRPEFAPAALLAAAVSPWSSATGARGAVLAVSSPPLAVPRRRAYAVLLAAAPPAIVVALRLALFGHPVPLAVAAKPSDLSHGFLYLAASMVVGALPAFLLDARGLLGRGAAGAPDGRTLRALVTVLVHGVVVVFVGGDWMPFGRFFVPMVPSLVVLGTACMMHAGGGGDGGPAKTGDRVSALFRAALAAFLVLASQFGAGRGGRHVLADRLALIEQMTPVFATSTRVAALDVGWVSAAFPGRIVDLAGLTDPEIAVLGGGHTSKRVDLAMLDERQVDTLLFYGRPDARYGVLPARVVEQRLYGDARFDEQFVWERFVPLGATGFGYGVFRATKKR